MKFKDLATEVDIQNRLSQEIALINMRGFTDIDYEETNPSAIRVYVVEEKHDNPEKFYSMGINWYLLRKEGDTLIYVHLDSDKADTGKRFERVEYREANIFDSSPYSINQPLLEKHFRGAIPVTGSMVYATDNFANGVKKLASIRSLHNECNRLKCECLARLFPFPIAGDKTYGELEVLTQKGFFSELQKQVYGGEDDYYLKMSGMLKYSRSLDRIIYRTSKGAEYGYRHEESGTYLFFVVPPERQFFNSIFYQDCYEQGFRFYNSFILTMSDPLDVFRGGIWEY